MSDMLLQEDFAHPPARVWQVLTESDQLARWLMPNDFVAEPGRQFTLTGSAIPGFDGVIHGKVLDLEPPKRMDWAWRSGTASTTISFELQPLDTGTRLTITHGGFEGLPGILRLLLLSGGWKKELQRRITDALEQA